MLCEGGFISGDKSHVRKSVAGIRWTIDPNWVDFVAGGDGPAWVDLKGDASADCVKRNARRRVWRVERGGRVVYVKEYVSRSVRDRVRQGVRGGDVRREWLMGLRMVAAGVGTACPVAMGVGGRRSWLVTEAVAGSPLSEVWRDALLADGDVHSVRRLIAGVARFVADAHGKGFLHGDEHPENILVYDRGGEIECHYIDIRTGRFSSSVSEALVSGSLGQLHQWFWMRSDERSRLRFLRAYCGYRCGVPVGKGAERRVVRVESRAMFRRILPMIVAETYALAVDLWQKRDARILRTNRYFSKISLENGRVAHVVLRSRRADRFPVACYREATVDQWRDWLSAEGDVGPTVVRLRLSDVGAVERCRLVEMFAVGHRLVNRDVPCRRPMAVVEGVELLLDADPESEGWLGIMSGGDLRMRRCVLVSLGELVGLMSDRGVSLSRAGAGTFGVCELDGACRVFVNGLEDVVVRERDPERDRSATSAALYRLIVDCGVYRRRDAAVFLKAMLGRKRWKEAFRQLASQCPVA